MKHRWFLDGDFPDRIPATAMDGTPTFPPISVNQSRRNFYSVCQRAKIGVELPIPAVVDATRVRTALGPSIMQQERDFRNAIQPDSPVSALLQYVALQSMFHCSPQLGETTARPSTRCHPRIRSAAKAQRRRRACDAQSRSPRQGECSWTVIAAHGGCRRGR